MTLWLIDRNQSHYRLTDSFAPAFYVSGPEERLIQLRDAARRKTTELRTRFTERTDLWLNAARQVLEVSVLRPSNFAGWGRWVHKLDSKLQLYNSDLMVASLYCWQKRLFPLSFVEVEADDEGKVLSIQCRDDEWALDYEMPPLKIMQIRLSGLARIDPTHGRRAALEIEMDGTCWELDETGEPPALQFARLLKRHDPDVILSEWGDSTILPLLRQQAERLRSSLPLNRDESAAIQQSRGRSYTSYGRILFKASSITLFGRIHVDKQNSFISEKCDFAGLWELARLPKLPIQYAARTTTGTGISYMQMELAHRDGVLIPEQKAEPEDPKRPDELLVADRGGLVFVPKLGFTRRTGHEPLGASGSHQLNTPVMPISQCTKRARCSVASLCRNWLARTLWPLKRCLTAAVQTWTPIRSRYLTVKSYPFPYISFTLSGEPIM
jgi:DNA polymerase-2